MAGGIHMDVTIKVPALEKLLDYAASGIGSVAGPMLASLKAGRSRPLGTGRGAEAGERGFA